MAQMLEPTVVFVNRIAVSDEERAYDEDLLTLLF